MAAEFGDRYAAAPEAQWIDLFRERAVAAMMDMIRADLSLLGIRHDVFSSEAAVQQAGRVDAAIDRLTKEGLMVVAGPFEGTSGDRALAGIFILKVESMDAARAAVDTDPAVKAGRFVYEIVPWWGPATLRY